MAPMPTRRSWAFLAWGFLLAAMACAPAAAAHPGEVHATTPAGVTPRAVEATVGDDVEVGSGGLYAVDEQGEEPLLTHGPDMLRAMPAPSSTRGFAPGDLERDPVCGTDNYQRFFYAHAPGTPDRYEEVKAEIQAAVRRMNAVLNTASLASGGGSADLKVLCDETGGVRVDRLVASSSLPDLVDSIEDGGFESPGINYTIFYDGDAAGACGIASYANDERLAPDNEANEGGGYAVVYDRCWFNEGPMHEMAHNQGAVQYGAPHSTGTGGHCNEELDVVCYSPDGGDLNQGAVTDRCPNRIQFDCGADDYFDTAPEPGEYLSQHWNLGSPLNRFMVFGERPPEATPEPMRLRDDRTQRGASAGPGVSSAFWVRVPRKARRLRVTVLGPGIEDLDLYVGTSRSPGEESYRCRSTTGSSIERCVVRHPEPGRWYAGVPPITGDAGVPFRVTAER
jgi:hypothetical protein